MGFMGKVIFSGFFLKKMAVGFAKTAV